ncbi:hypothetical protein K492DRAFT_176864 [Lichtheimia hyalospora FSU 10163]|nr:hypothetical protein K492DRAFT_176864 [Lichtheimia hyalospora FSU 10163]
MSLAISKPIPFTWTPKANYVLRDNMGKILQHNIPPRQVKRVSDDPNVDGVKNYPIITR